MENIIEWTQNLLESSLNPRELQARLISSVLIIVGLWILRLIILRLVDYETHNARIQYQWRKTLTYILALVGIIVVGRLWLAGMQSLATYLGLVSAGLAIALQGPLTNLAGWIFIIWRRPFDVGDRVQIGDHAGDVVDIRIFQFTLLEIGAWVQADQSTGRILHVPNRHIFDEALINFSQGFEYLWNEMPVLVTFESNWEKAKQLLQEIANHRAGTVGQAVAQQVKRASRRYLIMYSELTPTVYTRVEPSGVLLTIRYLCLVRRRRSSEQEMWEDILRAFAAEPDINFAYPTQRFYTSELGQPANIKLNTEDLRG